MKHILVPTDFSEAAGHALNAALQFADHFRAEVHLLSCTELPDGWENLSEEEKFGFLEIQVLVRQVAEKFDQLKAQYPSVSFHTSFVAGSLVDSIQEYVKAQAIDFIVMGAYGNSGHNELFIGANTQKVIRSIHRPVLIVKKPINSIAFKKVVFASSFNRQDQETFLRFKKIVAPFEPEIFLVAIDTPFSFGSTTTITAAAMEDFKALAAPYTCHPYIYKNSQIEAGIRSFSEEIGAELIAVSNHNRSALKRMLVGSTVEALVNYADLPVLCIDYEED